MSKNYKYIDIHAHLNFEDYEKDLEEVIARTEETETLVINVGTDQESSKKAVELAEKYENLYAIVGLHPTYEEEFDLDFYKKLCESEKVVGIGECGLDYFVRPKPSAEADKERPVSVKDYDKVRQIKNFKTQIELALEKDLPLMIHCREAYGDVLDILEEYKKEHGDKLRANFHFFAGNLEETKRILDLGFNFSFTGVITFAKDYEELVKFLPIERIMSETDCPYVTPVPYRGKRNEPAYVCEVSKKIAEIKGMDEEEVRGKIMENAKEFFNIK